MVNMCMLLVSSNYFLKFWEDPIQSHHVITHASSTDQRFHQRAARVAIPSFASKSVEVNPLMKSSKWSQKAGFFWDFWGNPSICFLRHIQKCGSWDTAKTRNSLGHLKKISILVWLSHYEFWCEEYPAQSNGTSHTCSPCLVCFLGIQGFKEKNIRMVSTLFNWMFWQHLIIGKAQTSEKGDVFIPS